MIFMKVNRRRNITLTVRLTEEEKAHIVSMAKKANLSRTDYIVELEKLVPIVVPENVKPLLIELRRIGNNINQIATRSNMDIYQRENFEGIINELKKLMIIYLRLGGEINGNSNLCESEKAVTGCDVRSN